MVMKSLRAPSVKGTPTCASKRLKKIATVGTSLEAHQSAVLSKNLSIALFSYFSFIELSSHAFVLQSLMQKNSLPWR
jgi:hypothetical protein